MTHQGKLKVPTRSISLLIYNAIIEFAVGLFRNALRLSAVLILYFKLGSPLLVGILNGFSIALALSLIFWLFILLFSLYIGELTYNKLQSSPL